MDVSSSQSVNAAIAISSSVEGTSDAAHSATMFENPFSIEDVLVFDDATMQGMLSKGSFGLTLEDMAGSLHGASEAVIAHVTCNVPAEASTYFLQALQRPLTQEQVQAVRRRVLDALFWELVYWKTPELYEELTEGEQLHPGIFQQLEPDLRNKTVLDVGAGSGRASFECVRYGARLVYAVEPSPGLLRILQQKLTSQPMGTCIVPYQGSFERIPLAGKSVDTALSCSASRLKRSKVVSLVWRNFSV